MRLENKIVQKVFFFKSNDLKYSTPDLNQRKERSSFHLIKILSVGKNRKEMHQTSYRILKSYLLRW